MVLDYSAEKAYIFDHSWRQFKQKLVFPDLQHVDWNSYYTIYRRFLPHINNNYDFAEMLSEMLGEMNVSHTDCFYRPNVPNSDATASLGLLYDYGYTGNGVRVAEVLQGGPVDLARTIKPATSSRPSTATGSTRAMDFTSRSIARPANLRSSAVYDPAANKRREETVKPVDRVPRRSGELFYKRWVRQRRERMSRNLSGGRMATSMSAQQRCERRVFEEALGLRTCRKTPSSSTRASTAAETSTSSCPTS